jgi:hypothetical protein
MCSVTVFGAENTPTLVLEPYIYRAALQRKSFFPFPFLGIARLQSQFPCVCERFIYFQYRSTYFPAAEEAEDRAW